MTDEDRIVLLFASRPVLPACEILRLTAWPDTRVLEAIRSRYFRRRPGPMTSESGYGSASPSATWDATTELPRADYELTELGRFRLDELDGDRT